MNRKTLFCFLTALIMIFVLAGCSGKNSGGNIDNVQIPDWKPSESKRTIVRILNSL